MNTSIVSIEEHRSQYDGNPAVYVGTYGKYNGGSLDGMWVDLTTFSDYDEFIEFCEAIHSDEDDPELMFQDYENFPKQWYDEFIYEDEFDKIIEYANLSDNEQEAVDAYFDEISDNAEIYEIIEKWQGEWDDEEAFAQHIFEECYEHNLSDFAIRYFDMEAFARDLFAEGYTFADGHVFSD